ncbi:MAG: OmpA family protein [Treponema sp.]|nr:OmpA family protein [Treponema sp.]
MKKTILLSFALFLAIPLFSEPVFFAGLHGDFSLPGITTSEKVWGYGGGANAELGAYIGNFSTGLLAGFSTVSDSGSLVEKVQEIKVGAQAGFTINKEHLSFLPNWIGFRPNIAVLADIYNAEGYRSQSKKTLGQNEKSDGIAFAGEAAFFIDFINLIKSETLHVIPALGYSETIRLEEDGPIFSGRVSLGLRVTYTPKKIDYDAWLAGLSGGSLMVKAPTRSKLFCPDGDGVDDIVEFDITSDADKHGGVASWEFRVYDPGDNLFYSQKGKGEIPGDFVWSGESINGDAVESGCLYQYVWYIKAKDNSDGFVPGLITTGIMIHERDGALTFSLSSIQFGPDTAGFDKITEEQLKRNHELLDQVAEILKKYSDYNITIEGHANNVTGTEREHLKELLPLSQKRAETIKRELVKRGIEAGRMTPVGRGSEVTISTKKENWWKNRRVEFIMVKKGE